MYVTPRQKRRYVITTIILAIALPLTAVAAYFATQWFTSADVSAEPRDVVLSTVMHNSAIISWQTDVAATGAVKLTVNGQERIFLEKRGETSSRLTHFVEVYGLEPNTTYDFSIISNELSYTDEAGNPFRFQTVAQLDSLPTISTVFGIIPGVDSDDFLVHFVADSAYLPVSAVPDDAEGNWYMDISSFRDQQGNPVSITDNTNIKLVIIGPEGLGAVFEGTYGEAIEGEIVGESVDLTLAEIPDIITELPDSSRYATMTVITTGGTTSPGGTTTTGGPTTGGPTSTGSTTTGTTGGTTGSTTGTSTGGFTTTSGSGTSSGGTTTGSTASSGTGSGTTGFTTGSTTTTTSGSTGGNSNTTGSQVAVVPPSTFNPATRQFKAGIQDVSWTNLVADLPAPLAPQNVTVGQQSLTKANLTDNNLTLVWVTDSAVPGYVKYGTSEGALTTEAKDMRDTGATKGDYNTHVVSLRNLTPDTTYYYEVYSGSEIYRDSGSSFRHTTYETLDSPPQGTSVQGSISGSAQYNDMIVLLELADKDGNGSSGKSNSIATLVSSNGSWLAGIGDARNSLGSEYFEFSDSDEIVAKVLAYAESTPVTVASANLETTEVKLSVSQSSGVGGFVQAQKFTPLTDYGISNAVYAVGPRAVAGAAIEPEVLATTTTNTLIQNTGMGGSSGSTTGVTIPEGSTTPNTGIDKVAVFSVVFVGLGAVVISFAVWLGSKEKVISKKTMGSLLK